MCIVIVNWLWFLIRLWYILTVPCIEIRLWFQWIHQNILYFIIKMYLILKQRGTLSTMVVHWTADQQVERVIRAAPGTWFITKFIALAMCPRPSIVLQVQNRGKKHHSFQSETAKTILIGWMQQKSNNYKNTTLSCPLFVASCLELLSDEVPVICWD